MLKRFSGDWAFQSSVHSNPTLSAIDKFNHFHSLLEQTAAEAVAGVRAVAHGLAGSAMAGPYF